MTTVDTLLRELGESTITRGTVVRVEERRVLVTCGDENPMELECEVLRCSERALRLGTGDTVLVWRTPEQQAEGVILGRVGPPQALEAEEESHEVAEELPARLIIEAASSLTLRVGNGSITIREDGKILIKGKDLVSHATRLNRIKGGAVQIN